MQNVLKLLVFALTAIMLSCADYPELDLSVKYGNIKDNRPEANGKEYKTVIIDEQEWMAENLNYAGEDGTIIGLCYNDVPENCKTFGRLYTWAEAMKLDSAFNSKYPPYVVQEPYQGICPNGWHLPSYDEWIKLLDYVGNKEGLKLKTTSGWVKNSVANNGTNEYGFSAIPAGCHYEGDFQRITLCGAWWSISERDGKTVKSIQICDDEADKISFLKASWASIRCIKDKN